MKPPNAANEKARPFLWLNQCGITVDGMRVMEPCPKNLKKKKETQQSAVPDIVELNIAAHISPIDTIRLILLGPNLSTARPTKGIRQADVMVAVAYKKEILF